jgi:hypothetical protein
VLDGLEGADQPQVDYADYCSGDGFFADGNYQCFSAIMSNPLNTPIGMALAVDQVATAKYLQEKETAELMATSTGVLPQVNENGDVKIPSSVVEEIQLQQVKLPLESLANGDTSVFSMLIETFAVQLIVSIMDKGLGEVENASNQNSDAFDSQFGDQLGDMMDGMGPGADFGGFDDLF